MIRTLLPVLLLVVANIHPVFAQAPSGIDEAAFESALLNATSDPDVDFDFSVHCRDEASIRSARLYSSGIAVWHGKLQVFVGSELRRSLLNDFVSSGFSSFASRYGGKIESGRSSGPLRISCSVQATIDGLQKISVQLADGEQSQALAGLAATLLDRIEPLAASGIAADSMKDGFQKVVSGTLAPEVLTVRLVQMPEESDDSDGDIVRVDAARWSWQAYQPGKAGRAADWKPLPSGFAQAFAEIALEAQFWALPVNVPGTEHREIEIRVLDQRKTVISRAFTRIKPGTMVAEKERFDAVIAAVGKLER